MASVHRKVPGQAQLLAEVTALGDHSMGQPGGLEGEEQDGMGGPHGHRLLQFPILGTSGTGKPTTPETVPTK